MELSFIRVDPAGPCLKSIFISGYSLRILMRLKPVRLGSVGARSAIREASLSVRLLVETDFTILASSV
jgi:hypothetical protein